MARIHISDDASVEAAEDKQVAAKQVELLYRQALATALATVFAALFLALILWEVVDHRAILGWVTLVGVFTIGRVLLVRAYEKAQPSVEDSPLWRGRIILVSGLVGLIWGLAGTLLFPETSLPHQAFMGFVFAGLAAGAVPYLSAVWPAYILLLVPITLPYALRLLALEGAMTQVMGLLVLFYAGMMAFTSRSMNRIITESIRLRFDTQTLAKDLEFANEIKEQAKLAAKEGNEQVYVLADAPFEGIFIHEKGKILNANQTLLDMLHVQLEDVLGRNLLDFVPAEAHELAARELSQPTGEYFECMATRADGEKLRVEVRGRHFPRHGRTIRVVSLREIPL